MNQGRFFGDESEAKPKVGAYGGYYGGTPPHSNATTSRAAARAIAPVAGSQRADVLDFIRGRGEHGATDDEIEASLGLRHQAVSPRRIECMKDGFVADSGRTRPTRSGRSAIVWVAKGGES